MLDGMRTVQSMLEHEVPFERIEAFIDNTDLCREEQAVLWLYAWVGGDPISLAEDLGGYRPRPVVRSHTLTRA